MSDAPCKYYTVTTFLLMLIFFNVPYIILDADFSGTIDFAYHQDFLRISLKHISKFSYMCDAFTTYICAEFIFVCLFLVVGVKVSFSLTKISRLTF